MAVACSRSFILAAVLQAHRAFSRAACDSAADATLRPGLSLALGYGQVLTGCSNVPARGGRRPPHIHVSVAWFPPVLLSPVSRLLCGNSFPRFCWEQTDSLVTLIADQIVNFVLLGLNFLYSFKYF